MKSFFGGDKPKSVYILVSDIKFEENIALLSLKLNPKHASSNSRQKYFQPSCHPKKNHVDR